MVVRHTSFSSSTCQLSSMSCIALNHPHSVKTCRVRVRIALHNACPCLRCVLSLLLQPGRCWSYLPLWRLPGILTPYPLPTSTRSGYSMVLSPQPLAVGAFCGPRTCKLRAPDMKRQSSTFCCEHSRLECVHLPVEKTLSLCTFSRQRSRGKEGKDATKSTSGSGFRRHK